MTREQLNTDLLLQIVTAIQLNTIAVAAGLPRSQADAVVETLTEIGEKLNKLADVSCKLDKEENNA